jgi:hypothetical protein
MKAKSEEHKILIPPHNENYNKQRPSAEKCRDSETQLALYVKRLNVTKANITPNKQHWQQDEFVVKFPTDTRQGISPISQRLSAFNWFHF